MSLDLESAAGATSPEVPILEGAPVGEPVQPDSAPSTEHAESSTATTAEGAAAEAAGATPEQVAEIEGRLNGQPFKLPANLELPWKRGNETGFASIEQIRKEHMLERDYRMRTSELAEQRRAFESERQQQAIELEKYRRQMEVERQFVERENQRMMQALTDPDPAVREKYIRHLDALQNDPQYREAYQKSLKADAYEAVQAFEQEYSQEQQVQSILSDIQETAQALAAKYPTVDVQRAVSRYGQAVAEGRASLKVGDLEAIFQDEHQYLQRSVTPVMSELEALKAEIAALKQGTKATEHNQSVRSQIAKQTTARAVAAIGAAAPPNPAAATTPRRREDRRSAHERFLAQP